MFTTGTTTTATVSSLASVIKLYLTRDPSLHYPPGLIITGVIINLFISSEWVVCSGGGGGEGGGESHQETGGERHHHQHSPSPGAFWNSQQTISFDRIKLTNNKSSVCPHQVCLDSMHKYQPVIQVRSHSHQPAFSATFSFPQTVFTTVTAYQNQQVGPHWKAEAVV